MAQKIMKYHPLKEWSALITGMRQVCTECDPAFRVELARLSRVGLWLASLFAIFGPLIGIGAHLVLGGDMAFMYTAGVNGIPVASELVTVFLGILGFALSFRPIAGSYGRLIVAIMVTIMFGANTLQEVMINLPASAAPFLGTNFIMLMLVAVGTMPFQGKQIALVGLSMSLVYFGASKVAALQMGYLQSPATVFDAVFLTMVTLFGVGISALLYGTRSRLIFINTEREELLSTVTFSERKYRTLFKDSTDAMFVLDNRSNLFAEVNQAFSDLVNISTEELYRTNFLDCIAPESKELAIENRRRRAAGEDVAWRYPIKVLRRGTDEPLICDMTVHRVDDPDFTMGALRDITEVMKSQERVRKIARIPEENPNPVIRVNYEGHISYRNPSADRFLQEIGEPGCSITDILPGDFLNNVRQAIDTGETIMFHEHRTHDRTLAVTYNPYPAAREAYVWLMDVTEKVKAYDQIKLHAEELELKNREIQETRSQLVQSEKMAALGNLVAGVAHEINTPLGAINSNTDLGLRALKKLNSSIDLLRESIPDSRLKDVDRYLKALMETNSTSHMAADRIVRIVRSLRNFARLDEAELKRADLHEGIDSTLTLLLHETKHRIEIVKEFGEIPEIECYPNQLNQVFMNLLVNASQAIEGSGRITISTRKKGTSIVLTFADTGRGIAKENLEHIFDPGFTTKGVGVGTGLGLSIVYRIIADHNGEISVKSEPGKGTTFTIRLPIR